MNKGPWATMTHHYKRNGTKTLFAALDVRRARRSASACCVTAAEFITLRRIDKPNSTWT